MKNYIKNLSASAFAEIVQKYAEYYDIKVCSKKELIQLIVEADYTWADAQADGLSMKEFIFWWR